MKSEDVIAEETHLHAHRRNRKLRGELQRQAILDAFEGLMGEKPTVDISVTDIAAKASIKRPNFYSYFDSKEDVLRELVNEAWRDWAATIGTHYRLADESHSDYFDRVFGASHAAWVARSHVMVAGVEATTYNDKIRSTWNDLVADQNRHLSEQMRRDASSGKISPVSEDYLGVVTALTDMIVIAFHKDRSFPPSLATSERMLANLKAIWLAAWGVPR